MKKIFVFIKDVPNTDKIKIDHEKGVLKRETAKTIINPPDETAIYFALKLKKELDFHISAFCMGPYQSIEKLKSVLSLGFDQACFITSPTFAGSDTLATATVLKQAAIKLGKADLYFFGSHSLDGDTGQIPGEFCELMNIPSVSCASHFFINNDKIHIFQNLEEKRELECDFPIGISFLEDKKRKMPLISAKSYFQNKKIQIFSEKELGLEPFQVGLKGSPTQVIKVWPPECKREPIVKPFSHEWINQMIQEEIIKTNFLTI